MMDIEIVDDIEVKIKHYADQMRFYVIRMVEEAKSGHPGASLSIVDIIATLYFGILNLRVDNPGWKERDRFILSKGHGVPSLYAALALKGFFPIEELLTLRKINSRLQGHPHINPEMGIEVSTGSLGQGLSIGVGLALGSRLNKLGSRVYVLIGDGEMNEGQIWEAVACASHYGLNNLTVIIDKNGSQVDGKTKEVMNMDPVAEKWKSFGWDINIIDGHNIKEIYNALEKSKYNTNPTSIIANTIKGRGVSFLENRLELYGEVMTSQQFEIAKRELMGYFNE